MSEQASAPAIELTPTEARIIGVLIEKAHTVPASYPMTVNGIVTGASQTSNRHPVREYQEEEVYDAIDALRRRGLVTRVEGSNARVPKYRHELREKLGIANPQLAVLAELMLRGPQTLGELRGRASRIHNFESLEAVKAVLDMLASRQPALVKQIAPAPGSRAERYVQLLAPKAHRLDDPGPAAASAAASATGGEAGPDQAAVLERVAALELEVVRLRNAIGKLAGEMGAPDPLQ